MRQQRGGRIWVAAQIAFDHSCLCTLLKMFQGVAPSFQGVAVKHRPRRATLTRRARRSRANDVGRRVVGLCLALPIDAGGMHGGNSGDKSRDRQLS